MFKIPQVQKESFYSDRAIKAMQEYAEKERKNIGIRFAKTVSTQRKTKDEINLNKRKDLELAKIRYLNETINRTQRKIIKSFPNFLKTDEIYLKLIDTSPTPTKTIKDSLGILRWIADAADDFTQNTEYKIKKAKSGETVGFLMKKHLGKINSLYRKNKDHFKTLEDARKFMNKLPKFEDLYTTSIAGFPNVGKSTLMQKVSGSKVEVQNYPFTTKGLMFSYLKHNGAKAVQLIDTPGLLNRNKSNDIERRAQIVLNDYCNSMVFVIDVTESCGYDINSQIKLLKNLSEKTKNITIYFSKTDIFNEEDEENFSEIKTKLKKYSLETDSNKLKESIIENYLKTKSKFDPNKLKVIK